MSGAVFGSHTGLYGEALLASSGQRLEMPPDTLQCPGQTLSPQQNHPAPDINRAAAEKLG